MRALAGRAAAAFLVTVASGLPSLILPWGRDQGIYAFTAWRMLNGALPYRDVFSFKPPMTTLVHAVAFGLFGVNMTAIRLLDLGWQGLTGVVVWGLARRASGSDLVGIAAAGLFGWSYFRWDQWTSAQTDGWASLPVGAAFLALVVAESRQAARAEVAAGALLAVAFLFKYTFGAFLAVALLLVLWRDRRVAAWPAARLVAGFVGLVMFFALIGLATGTLSSFVAAQLEVTLPYTGVGQAAAPYQPGWSTIEHQIRLYRDAWLGLVGVGLVAATGVSLWRRDAEGGVRLAIVAWFVGAFASGVVQGKYFPYHFLPILAPGAALAAWVVVMPLRAGLLWMGWRSTWLVLVGLPVLVGSWSARPFAERWALVRAAATNPAAIGRYWRSKAFVGKDMSLADNLALADFLRENSAPGDPVFVWGYEPMVYVLADRRPVSRFPYSYPFVVPWSPPSYRLELGAALATDPPVWFIVGSKDATPKVTGHRLDSAATFLRDEDLHAWVTAGYVRQPDVARFQVWRRSEP